MKFLKVWALGLSLAAVSSAAPHKNKTGQMQPDPQRVAEIQAALLAHGYASGRTWGETQEICRQIADGMKWQTDHAPDARVLILIGLGNRGSNPNVAHRQGNHLDEAQREEAARREIRPQGSASVLKGHERKSSVLE